jgi:hypothetical protein
MSDSRLYIHTTDGRPGYFDGDQIVVAELRDHWQDAYPLCVARTSVAQIRSDQKASKAFRERHGWNVPRYDFVIVATDPHTIGAEEDRS